MELRNALVSANSGDAKAGVGRITEHRNTISTDAIRNLDVPQIRLHDAWHTRATLMHLQNLPFALVDARLSHTDVSFTLRTDVDSQPEALHEAAESFGRRPSQAAD